MSVNNASKQSVHVYKLSDNFVMFGSFHTVLFLNSIRIAITTLIHCLMNTFHNWVIQKFRENPIFFELEKSLRCHLKTLPVNIIVPALIQEFRRLFFSDFSIDNFLF